jgi:DNA-directed RNA polymerase specialized sigma24 family protein
VPHRHKRPVRLSPDSLENVARTPSDAVLEQRLYEALSELPVDERAAAMICFGLAEGSTGVAVELDLTTEDADAIVRAALQHLRAALGDIDLEGPELFATLRRRRRRTSDDVGNGS